MAARVPISRRIAGSILAGIAALTAIAALSGAFGPPAGAQVFDDRYPFLEQRRMRGPPPSPLDQFPETRPSDFSRPPPPAARPSDAPAPTNVLVLGDAMADWLAYGLEDAFSDTPELGVIRRPRTNSGLIRYDTRPDSPDWAQAAREIIEAEKPNFIVMMIGINDRQPIRDRIAPRAPAGAAGQLADAPKPEPQKADTPPQDPADSEQPTIVAEPQRPAVLGSYEFRTEKWEELYSARIDETIAVLKARGVPVYWVGLPSVRGLRSTGEMSYLNDVFRARAEKAGIVFVDVWDGFVDEAGRFAVQGPDFEGQIRRLRTGDGVYFTKPGARKLAHYIEREIRRGLSRVTPVALPEVEENLPQAAKPGAVAARPLVGPVVPLTATTAEPEELLGAGAPRQTSTDPVASRVLTRGEPATAAIGRADDFVWPPRPPITEASGPLPAAPPPVAVAPRPTPAASERTAAQNAPGGPPGRFTQSQGLQPQGLPPGVRPPPQNWRPPPPSPFGGIFGIFR